ncbi:TonB-dependent siderophore receptor [Glaciecola sp. MH2013]|uniref:TonB-dependent receptor n=1 Tax=Glaciecola sp. MH2013 TaxID=2785524 RepID=UPI00189EB839|nr:TonB-dependent siderophore receptor [Glaciecola sp. MH2013]MBF7073109.1 TonB-dependent siderophore receptor [Glaciecola sp. MH2013]
MKFIKSSLAIAIAVSSATANANIATTTAESVERITVRGAFFGQDSADSLKTPTALVNVPSSLTIIDAAQIEQQAFTSIADILQYTPGASSGQGEDHRDQMTLRGQNTTADFFIDGLRDDVQYFRPLYNLERVEILRGSNALLFGRGGGGGVVNRVSKTADTSESFTTINAALDTFAAYNAAIDMNKAIDDNQAVRINAVYESMENHRDNKEGDRFAVNPTYSLFINDDTKLTLSYEYVNDERVIDRGVPSDGSGPLRGQDETLFGDPDFNLTTFEGHIARSVVEHNLSENWSINGTLQYADYDKLYQNYYPAGYDADTNLVTIDNYIDPTQRQNLIFQVNAVGQIETGDIEHTILMGAEYGDQDTANKRDELRFNGSDKFTVELNGPFIIPTLEEQRNTRDRASNVKFTSVFLQDEAQINDWLILVAGLRYDSFDIDVVDNVALRNDSQGNFARKDTEVSPRFGAIVKPNDDMSFYVSYSKSFLPRSGDQFLTLNLNSEALAPEEFENREIGMKWNPTDTLAFTAAIFEIERENGSVVDPTNPERSLLTGTTTDGFELQLVGNITDEWEINAGYSYLDGEEMGRVVDGVESNRTLSQVPENMFTLWNNYAFSDKLSVGLGYIYQSEQFTSLSNAVELPSFSRVDVAAYYQLNSKTSIQLNIENLLDEDYFSAAHNDNNITVAEPVNARVSLSYTF